MIPRPAQCDDDHCDYDTNGVWRHHPACWEREQDEAAEWLEEMAAQTALEDGVHHRTQPTRTS